MRQFVLPPDWKGGNSCILSGEAARYLLSVLRMGPGAHFPGLDGQGRRYEIEVRSVGQGHVDLSVRPDTNRSIGDPEASGRAGEFPRIVLVQALPKGRKMDLVVRQAAEAGVSRILPVESCRSVARIADEGGAAAKRGRWERIVREALQQSGSATLTAIEPPVPLRKLSEALGEGRGTRLGIYFHEAPLDGATLHRYLSPRADEIVACVGPEGGFSDEEIAFFDSLGFKPAHLGATVLRTETAALFAVAAIKVILLERSSWTPTE
jgi:16S rRNA (uracil1498-N3)-methyltransferase